MIQEIKSVKPVMIPVSFVVIMMFVLNAIQIQLVESYQKVNAYVLMEHLMTMRTPNKQFASLAIIHVKDVHLLKCVQPVIVL